MQIARLLHTLRPLRARQVTGRVRKHLRGWIEDPAAFARRCRQEPGACRWRPAPFLPPGPQRNRADDLRRGSFCFLDRTRALGWPPDWQPESSRVPKLWQYNLHYFEFLWSLAFEDARAVASDWIERHRLERGRVGWEPYPTSLRLINWCAAFFGHWERRTAGDREFRERLWRSIHLQAEWLAAHLETHLLGNHLLENAAALAVCGSCFDGPAAARWRRAGLALLRAELPEQLLADGGHFERSPMYHARATYLLVALVATGDEALAALAREPAERALRALACMSHPDGEIALLNDSAFGIYNRPGALRQWWGRVRGRAAEDPADTGGFSLPDTGYHGSRTRAGHYLICDAAPLGPDHLLGHAHADIFSFELSLRGLRVVTDAGVQGYEADALRRYCRSTRAHNTVEIEGEDQCELWSAFRVARRGRPRDVAREAAPGGFRLSGWHDGYARLSGRPRHARRFRWYDAGVLLVRDEVTAARPVRAVSRLHLHPDCEIERLVGSAARIRYPGGELALRFAGPGELASEEAVYCPEFGRTRACRALVYRASGARIEMGFCLADGAGDLDFGLAEGAARGGERFAW